MAVMTRALNPSLYTNVYDEFVVQGFNEVPKLFPTLFRVVRDQTSEYKTHQMGGLPMLEKVNEDAAIPVSKMEELWPKNFRADKYGGSVVVTEESMEDDENAIISKATFAKEHGKGAARKMDSLAVEVINGAFTSTLAPDGSFLCATDHAYSPTDPRTLSNKMTLAFGPSAVDEMERLIADNSRDSRGEIIELPHPKVLVPQALWGQAKELFDERFWALAGTANRQPNRFAGAYEPIVWRRLTNPKNWFMIASPMPDYGLIFWIRKEPVTSAWVDHQLGRYVFDIKARFTTGANEWRVIFGSQVI